MKLITVPFGYLLDWLYQLTNNYGFALILFAVIVQLVMLPITAKSKKGMMKMSRLTPKIQAIKEKYPDDKMKQKALALVCGKADIRAAWSSYCVNVIMT